MLLMRYPLFVTVSSIMMLSGTAALGVDYQQDGVISLSSPQIINASDGTNLGKQWQGFMPFAAPITINPGDSVQGAVSFGTQVLLVRDNGEGFFKIGEVGGFEQLIARADDPAAAFQPSQQDNSVEFTGVEGPILQNGGSRNGGVFHNGMFMQATPNMVDAGMAFTATGISYRLALVSGGPFTLSGVGFRVLAEEVEVSAAILDTDSDSIADNEDNCPDIVNPDQADADHDGIGDVCEPDGDQDGVADDDDNCVSTPNSDQQDADIDREGDVCDEDDDGDTVADAGDNCPLISNPDQADFDSDSQGDACDADVDGDGLNDADDQCLGSAPGAVTDRVGCSVAQLCPCENPSGWKNHGEYVKCVARTSEDFLDLGLITEPQKDAIVSKAGESQCGHKD